MRKLYQRDSSAFCLRATRRHQRLARQQKGAEKFADSIEKSKQALIDKLRQTELFDEKREDAYDDIINADMALDNTIRTTFESCRQYDRSNPGNQVLVKLFPNRTFSDIINMPYAEEPAEAERIATVIDGLGTAHPIYPMAAEIRAKIAAVTTAIEIYKQTLTDLTHAEVEEETAKATLRQKYEFNYLDSRKEFGATYSERIFPTLTSRGKVTGPDEPGQQDKVA